MSNKNVGKKAQQIKLIFGEGKRPFTRFHTEALMEELGLELHAVAVSAGKILIEQFLAAEGESLAGPRHDQTTEVDRWGHQRGYAMVGGQKVPIERPRYRSKVSNQEVVLDSYRRFQQQDERTRAVFRRMLAGVSCRHYGEAIEQFSEGYGISKSVVNREMIEGTSKALQSLLERRFDDFPLCVLLMDGIHLGETVFVVALGVDVEGNKRILGFREGSTENSEVCTALLADLVGRGLKTDRTILAILDGAKALRSAVRKVFGQRGLVQRCQFHKEQNVLRHLPERHQPIFRQKIRACYKMQSHQEAERALQALIKELTLINHSASDSLAEGLEETLTLHTLGLPALLHRSFCTTNMIESAFSNNRALMHNVKRWRDSQQKHRWLATTLIHGEKKFRKVRGAKAMPMLVNALGSRCETLDFKTLVA